MPSAAAHQIANRPSPWWFVITIRKARLPRTKKLGAPWLRRSVVSGSPRQISRIRVSVCSRSRPVATPPSYGSGNARQVRGCPPVSTLTEVAPGLRRWTTWHDEWRQEVGSLALQTGGGLALIDPINPPPEIRRPEHILLTVAWHARTAGKIPAKHVWAPARAVRRLKNRGVEVTDPFEPGDELPGGIQAYATAREAEVVYWLPDQRAVAVGDVLLGAGAKPHATSEPLRLCPERWLGDAKLKDLKKSLRPLLDLRLERIVVSHGEPVLSGAKDALAALVES